MNSANLTIALPTYNRERVLVDTLGQLLETAPTGAEILVVDQTSAHEAATSAALARAEASGAVRRVVLDAPSLTHARNTALREARGEIVLFLDDDIRAPRELFVEHLRMFDDPSVAAVTGQVFNCVDPDAPPALDEPRRGTRPHSAVETIVDARNISGGNHSVRRSVALAVGGYDEVFRGSALGEDLDFSQRLLLAGHRIVYNPAAWIIHLGIRSGGCAVGQGSGWPEWQHAGSLMVLAFRHGFRQRNFLTVFRMALRNGPLRREVVVRPWRWPAAWWGFLRGVAYGWQHRRFRSSPTPDT